MQAWPHQPRLVKLTLDAIAQGERRICLQAPTGAGKTHIAELLAKDFLARGKNVVAYTNRQLLISQMSAAMMASGVYHGVRADGYDEELEHPFQISSVMTEESRVYKKKEWKLHDCKDGLVLVDEAHIQTGPVVQKILCDHIEQGATYVGTTATPLGLAELYTKLITGVTMDELRKCGALVPAVHYGADEPDLAAWKRKKKSLRDAGENMSERQQSEVMMTPTLFGRVWEWYEKLNPTQKPCLLFGPSVEGSIWFAEQFTKKGVKAAHIDGFDIWYAGKWYKSDPKAREDMRNAHKDGKLKVVTNRYVLREGVDWPWIEHIILAFVAGSLQTYLQTCGRGLRGHTGKTNCIIQGHGGEWWRHGSVNVDREWRLDMDDCMAFGLRQERLRKKWCEGCKCYYETKNASCEVCFGELRGADKPFRCPKCGRVWSMGRECQKAWGGCGFVLEPGIKYSRPVVSTEGNLRILEGELFQPRRICTHPSGPANWEQMYWRSRSKRINKKGKEVGCDRTFNAAIAMFAQENYFAYPDRRWPYMPLSDYDLLRLVKNVPMSSLVPKSNAKTERFR